MTVMKTKTWLAAEIELKSAKIYTNPFEDVDVDAVFCLDGEELKIPAFWDGGAVWRIRFALPKAGTWHYSVQSTDKDNSGFDVSGEVECELYDGDLEIYKRGFLKTEPYVRYFMYNDGTPFFYLGDTHWNFAAEEFDEAGDHADGIQCDSHFKYIVDRRIEQGFTVYQSEPIGAKYDLSSGLTEDAVDGFKDLDRRFKYIADKGLVHANAQIAFPRVLVDFERYDDRDYILRLARYWAARYSAYPVLWTLGQEVDNDFYYNRGQQRRFTKENNPYKTIAEGLHKNDAYKHPLTAHMESVFIIPELGTGDGTCTSTSAFREVEGHTWYAYQWGRDGSKPIDPLFATEAYLNGQGKVIILYESGYDCLWSHHMAARSQGWLAYLNGMYGYGYGAIDIWNYKSKYDIDTTVNDGYDVITPEDKRKHWSESIEFETAHQMTYMKEFFTKLEWWKLVPRFNSPTYFMSDKEDFWSLASDERNTIVMYFADKGGYGTGTLYNLDRSDYTYRWFNPRTGEYSAKQTFTPDIHRTFRVPYKPDMYDWVFLVEKVR